MGDGPDAHERAADDQAFVDRAEVPRVARVAAVVTHHEDLVVRDLRGRQVVGHCSRRQIGLVERTPVDVHLAVLRRDRLAGEADDPLDQVLDRVGRLVLRPFEHDDVASVDVVNLVRELVDQHAVTDAQRRFHRSRRDVEGLQQERLDEQGDEECSDDDAYPLEDRLRVRAAALSSGSGTSASGGESDSITRIRRVAGAGAVRATR